MTDVSAWSVAADPQRRIGRAVEFHAALPSTNDRARSLLSSADGDGVAVVADHQTAGRGRQGRSWASPPGANLMVSVGLRPNIEAARAGLLAIAAGLAVRDTCAAMVPAIDFRIRWPNDVVTGDGRKVAGLLIETTLRQTLLDEAVIGIGLNVNWRRSDMPPEIAERAASLADLGSGPIDRVAVLSKLLANLDREIAQLESGRTPVDRFGAASALHGRDVAVDVGESRLEGTVAGIAADGALLLDTDAGRVALSAGEVVSVRDAVVELSL